MEPPSPPSLTPAERESLVFFAKLAEQAERYADMATAMQSIARSHLRLTVEERNLLSVAWKNLIGARRASWRIISSMEQKVEQTLGTGHRRYAITVEYRQRVETEIRTLIEVIISVLDNFLLLRPPPGEERVFYLKMRGDYYRYLAEIETGSERRRIADLSLACYQEAHAAMRIDLPPTHPVRLGMALSQSVFAYEILNQPQWACRVAKEAFDDAIAELDNLPEDEFKDATCIMLLLRDNLTLWTSDMEASSKDAEKEKLP